MASRSFKILAWHSINVIENTYNGSDQVAFAEDLETIDRCGAVIWPLADALAALDEGSLPEKVVVLTGDDGSILDFLPFDHPTCGPQPGFYRTLLRFAGGGGARSRHRPHLSCFVIASPAARKELQRKDFLDLAVFDDGWWRDANASGMLAVENHSWDHNHPSLDRTCQRENRRGDFRAIDTEPECRVEVDLANEYIERRSGRRPRFLAFPFGHASDYMIREYLPAHGPAIGLEAALACEPHPVTPASDRWNLPRYMFNHDWKSAADLEAVLRD